MSGTERTGICFILTSFSWLHDKSANGGEDIGMTYFSYNGPSTTETSFHNPSSANKEDRPARDIDSMNPSHGDHVDNKSTIPVRPRPLHDPQGMVLVPPYYPEQTYPGYFHLAPPFDPCRRVPSIDSFTPLHRSPFKHLKTINARYFVIVMGIMFLGAFAAAIFMAVYFGQKL